MKGKRDVILGICGFIVLILLIIFGAKSQHKIEMTDALKEELRSMIPTHCGGYDEELFQSKKIDPSTISKKSNDDCTSAGVHVTFTLEKRVAVSKDTFTIDDYVLIYSVDGEGEQKVHWANEYQKFD